MKDNELKAKHYRHNAKKYSLVHSYVNLIGMAESRSQRSLTGACIFMLLMCVNSGLSCGRTMHSLLGLHIYFRVATALVALSAVYCQY